ncbi:hypothetical protein BH20ACT9_BH20ACT9_12690 [soil metagenome]|jgi:hypothetical protein
MEKPETDNDTSSTNTQDPGEGREAEGDAVESLDEPLAAEHVHTQEQRNQQWTADETPDPRRDSEGEPLQTDSQPPPTLDMSAELQDKLKDVKANPHSDAEETSDTGGPLGGVPTGSGEQDDPMSQMGGGQSGG